MSIDLAPAHRKRVLQHCLWMAGFDLRYAQHAASQYEAGDDSLLQGLRDALDVRVARGDHLKPQPEATAEQP